MKNVLLLGLLPEVVDVALIPGLTREKLAHSLAASEAAVRDLGLDARWCLVDRGETAEAVVRAALEAKEYDVVLIGAGVRTFPVHFELFEKLINLVHTHAPKAKICFNTKPEDTPVAVSRWISAPNRAG